MYSEEIYNPGQPGPGQSGPGQPVRDRRYRETVPKERLRHWYKRYYQRGMSLKAIGRRVGVNPRYLSQLFKEAGMPVSAHVHERILPE